MAKTPQTPFRIPQPIRDRLEAEAKRTGQSLNAIVIAALDRYLSPVPELQPAKRDEEDMASFD